MINDEELAALLASYHGAKGDNRQSIGRTIIAEIEPYFRKVLRPELARKFSRSAQDTSVRYSMMVNEFFAEVLKKESVQFWQAESLGALKAFASTVISNDIRDVLRRQKKRGALCEDALDELASSRAEHFRGKVDIDLEWALGRWQEWDDRKDPWPARARVLRYRYVDGMDYDEIAAQEGVPKKVIYRIKEEAIAALRSEALVAAREVQP